ncbi:class I SAM-dependent methyltransferase [Kribbella sp. NPDC051587]|uniref:class I SAM-dependent methyltransferase n=1 Tax=Kribbella sp. NPDC051587 TaxID=3364119 RepID=UPI0037B453EE
MTAEMEAEFDDVAWWTCLAAQHLGEDFFIPAGCRGSGGPLALAWLAEACSLRRGSRLLDLGAGIDGPAAWVQQHYGVHPLLMDPITGAGRAAVRLFGLATVTAGGAAIPLAAGSIDTVWCIGVLCTLRDKLALLNEVHRVLRPGGSLDLLVLIAADEETSPQPEGNFFPTAAELVAVLRDAGFEIRDSAAAPDITPIDWKQRADEVEKRLRARYGDHPRYQEAEEQNDKLQKLLQSGQLITRLVHGVRSQMGPIRRDGGFESPS